MRTGEARRAPLRSPVPASPPPPAGERRPASLTARPRPEGERRWGGAFPPVFLPVASLLLAVFLSGGSFLAAQEQLSPDDLRMAQLIKDIREGMKEIDRNLLEAGSPKRGDSSFDALLNEARLKHRKVIEDIDELIRSIKYQRSSSSSGSGQSPQPKKKPGAGRRSEPERRGKSGDDSLKKSRDDSKKGKENPKEGGGSREKPRKEDARNPKKNPNPGKADHRDASGRWGLLPPKVQEEILNSNVEDFPQKYRKWLEEYYRRVGKRR